MKRVEADQREASDAVRKPLSVQALEAERAAQSAPVLDTVEALNEGVLQLKNKLAQNLRVRERSGTDYTKIFDSELALATAVDAFKNVSADESLVAHLLLNERLTPQFFGAVFQLFRHENLDVVYAALFVLAELTSPETLTPIVLGPQGHSATDSNASAEICLHLARAAAESTSTLTSGSVSASEDLALDAVFAQVFARITADTRRSQGSGRHVKRQRGEGKWEKRQHFEEEEDASWDEDSEAFSGLTSLLSIVDNITNLSLLNAQSFFLSSDGHDLLDRFVARLWERAQHVDYNKLYIAEIFATLFCPSLPSSVKHLATIDEQLRVWDGLLVALKLFSDAKAKEEKGDAERTRSLTEDESELVHNLIDAMVALSVSFPENVHRVATELEIPALFVQILKRHQTRNWQRLAPSFHRILADCLASPDESFPEKPPGQPPVKDNEEETRGKAISQLVKAGGLGVLFPFLRSRPKKSLNLLRILNSLVDFAHSHPTNDSSTSGDVGLRITAKFLEHEAVNVALVVDCFFTAAAEAETAVAAPHPSFPQQHLDPEGDGEESQFGIFKRYRALARLVATLANADQVPALALVTHTFLDNHPDTEASRRSAGAEGAIESTESDERNNAEAIGKPPLGGRLAEAIGGRLAELAEKCDNIVAVAEGLSDVKGVNLLGESSTREMLENLAASHDGWVSKASGITPGDIA